MGRVVGLPIRALSLVVTLVLWAGAHAQTGVPTPQLPQGEPLAVEASAIVPLESESAVSIVGIRGQIIVGTRDERELRAVSRLMGDKGGDLPVGIWQVGTKLIVSPPAGQPDTPRVLRVEVPKTFAVTVEASSSDVVVEAVAGSVNVKGRELRTTVRGCSGPLDAELTGGSLSVGDSADAALTLRGTKAQLAAMNGAVIVHANGGELSAREIHGALDVTTDGTKVAVSEPSGGFHIASRLGSVSLKGATDDGELALNGAALHLEGCKGDITVTSDAPVDFVGMAATLHFDMYGGTLRGKGNQGILEVRTRNTEINLESIEQGMRLQGDGLKARIVDVGGDLYVEASVSDVVIDRAAAVEARIDRGSVTIQRTGGPVKATVQGGDAHIIDGIGPVQLDIDGGDAEVSWASITGDKDSKLVNKSGAITVRFPQGGSCRVEAKSEYGRVDSDIRTVKVADDLESAQGSVNGGYRPAVLITAYGDIELLDGSKPPDENDAPR